MSKLSLFDKLRVLIELSASSRPYLIALGVLMIFGIILSFTNKKNEKIIKVLYGIMTIVIAVVLIASYHSSLGNMFSYMMNHFFIAVYFPTIAIYLAAIIAMNIIVWVSIFSFKSSKQIRTLNISIYIIMNYLMALLLKVVNTNKLDIFDQASLYGNNEATSLIELSSLVFVVWIVFLILYKLILIYVRKDYKPRIKKVIVRKQVKKLPENFQETSIPNYIYGNIPHRETLVIEKPKTEDEILLERFSKQFTIEDYKLFSRLLREEQERENKQKVTFIQEKNHQRVAKKNKKAKEVVVKSVNSLEEDSYRQQQKQVIIKMEEERRKLLKEEQEKQKRIEQQRIEEEKRQALLRQQEEAKRKQEEEERQKQLMEEQARQRQIEEQQKEQQQLEYLLQQTLMEEEREQRKLSELEMLYR